ncbi:FMN-binding protein [Curtobacterium citreum]|uniref:FMN-binding protein n=1 Tax=Curtobacterium citreum TaxID=2036 RepID=UPI0025429C34|nr:FMN-binding protein [Curtobacterium citreum]WIJ46749.1 FMN-binding protein [Curtobacterium citreum]
MTAVRTRGVVIGALSSVAVLAIGWQLGGQPAQVAASGTTAGTHSGATSGTSGTSATGPTGTGGTTATAPATAAPSAGGGSATGGSSASGTFTGTAAETRYGPVQVQVTVSGGKLTDVQALQLTNRDGRSVAISQQAAPILRQEALQAQSARIQAVSGATYTSEGYTTSLQSALDQAGL